MADRTTSEPREIHSEKGTSSLPKILSAYEKSDFGSQLKARFLYFICYAMAGTLVLLILFSGYLQEKNPIYSGLYYPVLLAEFGILIFVFVILIILIKGYFDIAAHLTLISSIAGTWIGMWMDRGDVLARFDSIVFILCILAMLPLLFKKYHYAALVYISINIPVLFVFVYFKKHELGIPFASAMDYLSNSIIALIFIGIVGFFIFRINKLTLEKAVSDVNERHEAEKALAKIEKKYSEMADMLPQTIFESDLNGHITYVNKNSFHQFGYTQDDFQKGVNIASFLVENDRARAIETFAAIIKGKEVFGNHYTALRKDGSVFPIQIYSSLIEDNQKITGLRGIVIDVSDRVQAEEKIRQTSDQFQSLVSNIPGITYRCIYDKNWTLLYISSEIEKFSGYPQDEFLGKKIRTFDSIIHSDDLQIVTKAMKDAINSLSPWEVEYRVTHRNGSIRWVYEKGRPLINPDGVIEYLDGFILDITQRKLSDKALKESEEKYRSLMESMNDVIMLVDTNDCIQYVNKKFTEILGYSSEEVFGKSGFELLNDPDDQKIILNADYNRKVNKVDQYEITFVSKSKRKIYFLVNAAPIKNAEMIETGTIIAMIDITERKEAEEALRQSEERYKTITESFPDIIMISDLSGNIIFGNDAMHQVTGITPEDYANPNRAAHIHPDDFAFVGTAVKDLLLSDKTHTDIIENRFIDSWGKTHWFSGNVSKISLNNNTVLQTITRDITEKKQIEVELENYRNHLELLVNERTEELESTNEELKSTNDELFEQRRELEDALSQLKNAQNKLIESEKMASLGVLAAGVAHEINNPLNFIQGGIFAIENYFSDTLKEHIENVSPLFDGIHVGIDRAAAIVASLNHYSHRGDLVNTECNIHSIIDNCLVILDSLIKSKVKIIKEYTEKPYTLKCNEGKLHQVFLNILQNSIHAIEESGVITISTSIKDSTIFISIKDNGCGISSEILQKIKDPFFTTKDPGEGTGLGLSISSNILLEYNGTLEFTSQEGIGTIALVSFPLYKE